MLLPWQPFRPHLTRIRIRTSVEDDEHRKLIGSGQIQSGLQVSYPKTLTAEERPLDASPRCRSYSVPLAGWQGTVRRGVTSRLRLVPVFVPDVSYASVTRCSYGHSPSQSSKDPSLRMRPRHISGPHSACIPRTSAGEDVWWPRQILLVAASLADSCRSRRPSKRSTHLCRPNMQRRRPNIAAADHRRPTLQRWRESAPGRNRTYDLALRRRTLYPLSYRREAVSLPPGGSPPTHRVGSPAWKSPHASSPLKWPSRS